jgi:predicted nucleotidyltransferase
MYTVQANRPLNPITLTVLGALHHIAAKHGASYFLIGATARDVLMTHVFGVDAGRATRDVDFAIALEDWSQFETIKQSFIDSGDFQSSTGEAHRLFYQPDTYGSAYPLDLIPFGNIASSKNTIAWPPDMATIMNVAGYAEALEHAIQVDVAGGLIVNVVSIPGLAALKILAWNDRGLEDNKDAQDFLFLLRHYHEAGNIDRVYEDRLSVLESFGYQIDLAGAVLLGHDTGLILEQATQEAVLAVLEHPGKRDRLAVHMGRALNIDSVVPARFIDGFEQGLRLGKR